MYTRYEAPPLSASSNASTGAPFSPFSSAVSISDTNVTYTDAEDAADLGAFNAVFAALQVMQQTDRFHTRSLPPSSSIRPRSPSLYSSNHPYARDTDTELDTDRDDMRSNASASSFHDFDNPSDMESDYNAHDSYHGLSRSRTPSHRTSAQETVWNQDPVADYLSTFSITSRRGPETDVEDLGPSNASTDSQQLDADFASLGAFQSAISFLAKERQKISHPAPRPAPSHLRPLTASNPAGHAGTQSTTSFTNTPSKPSSQPPSRIRRNRRQRPKTSQTLEDDLLALGAGDALTPGDLSSSNDDGVTRSSYFEQTTDDLNQPGPSSRNAPPRGGKKSKKRRVPSEPHSFTEGIGSQTPISVEAADPPISGSSTPGFVNDPELEQSVKFSLQQHLLALAQKLAAMFPVDAKRLSSMTFPLDTMLEPGAAQLNDIIYFPTRYGFWETGIPGDKARVHVFIDHSNIQIGFVKWVQKQFKQAKSNTAVSVPGGTSSIPSLMPHKPKLSHASLILLLERNRAVGGRHIAASYPLYQTMRDVRAMGYELQLLQRVMVPDESDFDLPGEDRTNGGIRALPRIDRRKSNTVNVNSGHSIPTYGSGGSSTESTKSRRALGHSRYSSTPNATLALSSTAEHPNSQPTSIPFAQLGRQKYREEAVDEVLQLHILKVILANPEPPPRGSTVVLATGDGAASQFNADGFLGCVRYALTRGWRVELVGWQEARSRSWYALANEFNNKKKAGTTQGGLVMIDLEQWGWDLYDHRAF